MRNIAIALALGLALAMADASARTQAAPQRRWAAQLLPVMLSAHDPRPVASALRVLTDRFKWLITYEDPRYVTADDMVERGRSARTDSRGERKLFVLRDGPWEFGNQSAALSAAREAADAAVARATTTGVPPEPTAVIQALIDAHAEQGYPDRYRLIRTGDRYEVVPLAPRAANGEPEKASSVLDARIYVPDSSRTLLAALDEIAKAVSRVTGERVLSGLVPINLAAQTTVTGGAQNESARDVLRRTLGAARLPLAWHLYSDPTDAIVVLNIHIVDRDSTSSRANR